MGLDQIRDEQIRKLAKTLRNSGIALSDGEAERMAREMCDTSQKVQKSYEEQNKSSKKNSQFVEEDSEDKFDEPADEDGPVDNELFVADEEDETDIFKRQEATIRSSNAANNGDILNSNKPISELLDETSEEEASSTSADSSSSIDWNDDLDISEVETTSRPPVKSNEHQSDQDEDAEPKQSVEKKPEKKKIDTTQESKIDLSDVFNFGKRK